ncbi:uncharacterized protein [Anser cygnoides]|uniref:uncharacterized protein n=1 Tax=Anser cygnoides TaxID=8845 RepID=UPI0034D33233
MRRRRRNLGLQKFRTASFVFARISLAVQPSCPLPISSKSPSLPTNTGAEFTGGSSLLVDAGTSLLQTWLVVGQEMGTPAETSLKAQVCSHPQNPTVYNGFANSTLVFQPSPRARAELWHSRVGLLRSKKQPQVYSRNDILWNRTFPEGNNAWRRLLAWGKASSIQIFLPVINFQGEMSYCLSILTDVDWQLKRYLQNEENEVLENITLLFEK